MKLRDGYFGLFVLASLGVVVVIAIWLAWLRPSVPLLTR